MFYDECLLKFFCKRDSKPSPHVLLVMGISDDVARYLRTSEIIQIDIEWIIPDLSNPNKFRNMDAPRVIIPGEQFFRQNKIDISKKEGNVKWKNSTKK